MRNAAFLTVVFLSWFFSNPAQAAAPTIFDRMQEHFEGSDLPKVDELPEDSSLVGVCTDLANPGRPFGVLANFFNVRVPDLDPAVFVIPMTTANPRRFLTASPNEIKAIREEIDQKQLNYYSALAADNHSLVTVANIPAGHGWVTENKKYLPERKFDLRYELRIRRKKKENAVFSLAAICEAAGGCLGANGAKIAEQNKVMGYCIFDRPIYRAGSGGVQLPTTPTGQDAVGVRPGDGALGTLLHLPKAPHK
jgi:hypothetical protein